MFEWYITRLLLVIIKPLSTPLPHPTPLPFTKLHDQARPKGGGVQLHPPFFLGENRFYFILFILYFLLVIEVGDVRRYPYPVSGKLTKKM